MRKYQLWLKILSRQYRFEHSYADVQDVHFWIVQVRHKEREEELRQQRRTGIY